MGFSIKLAPGVRIRASSRGIRTSVGPRIARVHVGAGRTGVSTGLGPVGFYTSLGGGRRRGGGTSSGVSAAAGYQRQLAAQQRHAVQVERADRARGLADAFLRILNLHRADFTPAARPVAPAPQQPNRAAIYVHYEKHALAGLSIFQRAERTQAKQRAAGWTEAEVQRLWTAACEQRAQVQQYFDHRWHLLTTNDPDVVLETLNLAFEDNEAPTLALGVTGADTSIVILAPSVDQVVPEQMPTTTQAGNLSFKKLPQRDRADYYKVFVCGQMLVTVREAFAVAPALTTARVAVLRNDGDDAYGRPRAVAIMAATFQKAALAGVQWQTTDAGRIVNDVSADRIFNERGRSGELAPINLAAEPDLALLVAAVDIDELAGE
ncbi:DUF4236 domain-containing protein [Catellatospora methionotrophica]|nr:DUF4236 domain-containing protein [Catellatospora methionotrophica]